MTAKEALRKVRESERNIRLKRMEIEELEAIINSVVSACDVRVQTSMSDRSTDDIVKLVEKRQELEKDIAELKRLKFYVAQIISSIPGQLYRSLLLLRYFHNRSWDEIAEALCYSYRHTLLVHGRALQEYEKYSTSYHMIAHNNT